MAENYSTTRRKLIRVAAGLPVVGFSLVGASARAQSPAPVCVDADEAMDGLRQSLHYTESSSDANATCSACSFFAAGAKSGCGECRIMNGPVNAHGHCDSWSKKPSS